jgi:hypothetical protein
MPGENKASFNGKSKDTFSYRSVDRIADFVPATAELTEGKVLFNRRFTPQDFIGMPRLKALSKLWSRYEIRGASGLKMIVVTKGPSSTTGGWLAYWDPESSDDPEEFAAEQRTFIATNHKGATEGAWWGKKYVVKAPLKTDKLYTDVTATEIELDPKWVYSHRFVLLATASAGLPTNSSVMTLLISANIHFSDPTIEMLIAPSPVGTGADLYAQHGGAPTALMPMGPSPTRQAGTLGLMVVYANPVVQQHDKVVVSGFSPGYYLPPEGRWFIQLEYVNTAGGMTAGVWSIPATFGSVIVQASTVQGDSKKCNDWAVIQQGRNTGSWDIATIATAFSTTTAAPTSCSLRVIGTSSDFKKKTKFEERVLDCLKKYAPEADEKGEMKGRRVMPPEDYQHLMQMVQEEEPVVVSRPSIRGVSPNRFGPIGSVFSAAKAA